MWIPFFILSTFLVNVYVFKNVSDEETTECAIF